MIPTPTDDSMSRIFVLRLLFPVVHGLRIAGCNGANRGHDRHVASESHGFHDSPDIVPVLDAKRSAWIPSFCSTLT